MKVLVDALPLRQGGGVTYLQHQMAALARVSPNLELHTLVSPWGQISGLPGVTEVVPVRSVPTRFLYEQSRLPFRQTDVLYCPANFAPIRCRRPVMMTLHNANYYRSGLALDETKPSRPWWKVRANHAAMRASEVLVAISQALADDVVATLPEVAHKLRVIHSGAAVWPMTSANVEGLPNRYILAVASSAPHKHLDDIVTGWARSLDLFDDSISLVLVGGINAQQVEDHRQLAGRHERKLLHFGAVRDQRVLKRIYEKATALVSMSVLEAFPLTPGEAGSVGCPLVLSDIPAHREVSMGNASFVRPNDTEGLAHTLGSETYSGAPGSRHWLWPFTWEDNARETAEVMESMCTRH